MKVPKTESTRFVLPRGVAGFEPVAADEGTLSYDSATGRVRVKTGSGWVDVGAGTGGPPSGAAGGDLGGTYPNPTVSQARALKSASTTIDVASATAPSSGQVLTATGASAATWQTPSSSPTGSAGGDLAGTYPNPTVTLSRGLKTASTIVDVASATAPTSGQVLTATGGSAATWQTPSGTPTGAAGGDLAGSYPNPTVSQARGLKSATTTVDVSSATAPSSGQGLVATSSTTATWQTIPIATDRYAMPYLSLPSSPDSWNLEARTMTNPDPQDASNGWTITLLDTPWTAQTRAGNLGTSLAANQYNSQIINGLLALQITGGTSIVMYKAITNAPFTYKTRIWHTNISTSSGSLCGVATGVQRKSGSTKSYVTGVDGTTGSGAAQTVEFFLTAPSSFSFGTNVALPDNGLDAVKYVDFTNSGGGNQQVRHVDAINGRSLLAPGSRLTVMTPTHFVVWLYSSNNGPIWIDFIRRVTYLESP